MISIDIFFLLIRIPLIIYLHINILLNSSPFKIEHIIGILTILCNIYIAHWITSTLQTKVNNNKAQKDFITEEIKKIHTSYKKFTKDLYQNKLNSREILEWYRLITIELQIIDKYINTKDSENILVLNNEFKKVLTFTKDFNEQFSGTFYTPGNEVKTLILRESQKISNSFFKLILAVNSL